MKNRIALRLLAYFAIAIVTFALVSGLLFQTLFTQQIIETKKAEMLKRVTSLAETLSNAMDETGNSNGKMGSNQGMVGYGAYVRVLSLTETDVWVLDENLQFLTVGHMMGQSLQYSDLPEDAETLVQEVFAGQSPFSEGFSDLLGAPTLTVGAPIYQGQKVAGALLLHDAVSGMQAAAAQGMRILLYSGAVALLLSILLAILLSFGFTQPINHMKGTALRLAAGDYTAKTTVKRNDELGELACTIDALSDRLQVAKVEGEQQEQLRRDFLTNISHELRTPVTVLRGSLEALCDGIVTNPELVHEYHRQMLNETHGMQRLVNDLLELSKLQNPAFAIESIVISMHDVLEDALHSAERVAQAKDVSIHRELTSASVLFQGDYGRLRQMFLIVLDNAIKFSSAHSTVTVQLDAHAVTIRDQGCGISAQELPLIFDRFHKSSTEENRQGSGLGLAIAKEVAERHGIHIVVESELDQGAMFRFVWEENDRTISSTLL